MTLPNVLNAADYIIGTRGGTAKIEGHQMGGDVSIFINNPGKGRGARKHRHPYAETFVLLHGEATAMVDDEEFPVRAGQVWSVPADTWHGFTVTSDEFSMVSIHPRPVMEQEDA
jgi:mannose-6-phosphate isomerase-like protein (cupin superfamily)